MQAAPESRPGGERGLGRGAGGSLCLDGKLSENPELRFQFRPAYWFVLSQDAVFVYKEHLYLFPFGIQQMSGVNSRVRFTDQFHLHTRTFHPQDCAVSCLSAPPQPQDGGCPEQPGDGAAPIGASSRKIPQPTVTATAHGPAHGSLSKSHRHAAMQQTRLLALFYQGKQKFREAKHRPTVALLTLAE